MRLNRDEKTAVMFGVGLDGDGGHRRITSGDNFFLYGGTEGTHAKMTEVAVKVNEKLKRRGKSLSGISVEEFRDLVLESGGGDS